MEITPIIPSDKKLITAYGNGGFKINNEHIRSSIIITAENVWQWDIASWDTLASKDFWFIDKYLKDKEILLFGTGKKRQNLPLDLNILLSNYKISVEFMDSGAACRTYNILLAESREVAASIIAV